MKTYECTFYGRLAGALGISYKHVVIVEAEGVEQARLKLYDTHEHISDIIFKEV